MRVMIMVKEGEEPMSGPPSSEMIAAMGRLNEEMINAGILLVAEGLYPSKFARKVTFNGRDRRTIDGPFSETKELIGGFWIINVESMDAAIEWANKIPFEDGEVEIRRVSEAADFERDDVSAAALDLEQKFHDETVKPIQA